MGLLSGSPKSTSTSTTDVAPANVGIGGSGTAFALSRPAGTTSVNIATIDHRVVRAAANLGKKSINSSKKIALESIALARDSFTNTGELATAVMAAIRARDDEMLALASGRPGTNTLTLTLLGAAVVVGLAVWRR